MKRFCVNQLVIVALIASAAFMSCSKEYSVQFMDEDGTLLCEEKLGVSGAAKANLKRSFCYPYSPEREGYEFVGWFNGDKEWDIDNDIVTSDLVLIARWKPIEVENSVAPELIGKWEAQSMVIKYLNFDYEDETVLFPREIEDWDERTESMGFEFTSNRFKQFANGSVDDEAEAYTKENIIYVSSTTDYNDFTWKLSDNILTLTVTITAEWDGGSGSVEYIMTFAYTCQKVAKFSWE